MFSFRIQVADSFSTPVPYLSQLSHCPDSAVISTRQPSIVRTASNRTFAIAVVLLRPEVDIKIACNSHYFLMTALDCLYGMYVTARYAKA